MRIAITGSTGQLGSALPHVLQGGDLLSIYRPKCDVAEL